MGEHTPLHACACLDHACRVRLYLPEALTCWPRCLPSPHLQCHFALPACRGRYCGIPHRGMLVVRRGGSKNDFWGRSNALLPLSGITGAKRYTLSQNVPAPCSTCTGSIIVVQLGPSVRLSDLSQPPKVRFEEWWMWWEPRPQIRVRASCIFQGQSSSHRPWVGVA